MLSLIVENYQKLREFVSNILVMRVISGLIGVNIIAKIQLIVPRFNQDDYHLIYSYDVIGDVKHHVFDGRYILAGVTGLNSLLGVTWWSLSSVNTVLSWVAPGFFVLLVAFLLRLSDRVSIAAFGLVWMLNPFAMENVTFAGYSGMNTIATILPICAVVLMNTDVKKRNLLGASMFLQAALMLYQPVIIYAVIILFLCALQRITDHSQKAIDTVKWTVRRLVVVAVNIGIYSFVFMIIRWIVFGGYADSPARRIVVPNVGDFVIRWLKTLNCMYWDCGNLLPLSLRLSLVILFVVATAAYCYGIRYQGVHYGRIAIAALILVIMIMISPGVIVFASEFWLPPRVLAQNGLVMGGICGLGLSYCKYWDKLTWYVVGILAFASWTMVGLSAQVVAENNLVSVRDWALANRIVARLEASAVSGMLERVVVVQGKMPAVDPFRSSGGSLNVSAFNAPWSQIRILELVSGYRFKNGTEVERQEALEYCAKSLSWPDGASISVRDQWAIICL